MVTLSIPENCTDQDLISKVNYANECSDSALLEELIKTHLNIAALVSAVALAALNFFQASIKESFGLFLAWTMISYAVIWLKNDKSLVVPLNLPILISDISLLIFGSLKMALLGPGIAFAVSFVAHICSTADKSNVNFFEKSLQGRGQFSTDGSSKSYKIKVNGPSGTCYKIVSRKNGDFSQFTIADA